jgi:predicted dehydrogenase
MRALVLGGGSIGRRHATNLAALGHDVMVADLVEERAAAVARECQGRATQRDAAPDVDLVVVATPTIAHVGDLEWALGRGAHVFVEKPLAASNEQLERAVEMATSASGQHVMVGCNLRFTEGFRLLSRELAGVPRIAALLIDFGWWLPAWRPQEDYSHQYSTRRALGGGIILDAIHELDYAIALAGPVTDVAARWSRTGVLAGDVEDVADIVLRHRSSTHTHVHVDYLRRRYSRSCTAITDDAELRWDYATGRVERLAGAGEAPEILADGLDADRNDAYVAEMRHFLDSISCGEPPQNTVREAAEVTGVALRALEIGAP